MQTARFFADRRPGQVRGTSTNDTRHPPPPPTEEPAGAAGNRARAHGVRVLVCKILRPGRARVQLRRGSPRGRGQRRGGGAAGRPGAGPWHAATQNAAKAEEARQQLGDKRGDNMTWE